jgi:hypothetical protein
MKKHYDFEDWVDAFSTVDIRGILIEGEMVFHGWGAILKLHPDGTYELVDTTGG